MDIRVDSLATVDIMVHGCPQLPEGQSQNSPVTPTGYQETIFTDKDPQIIPTSSSSVGSF